MHFPEKMPTHIRRHGPSPDQQSPLLFGFGALNDFRDTIMLSSIDNWSYLRAFCLRVPNHLAFRFEGCPVRSDELVVDTFLNVYS